MQRTAPPSKTPRALDLLPGLPRQALTPQQQQEALRRVQAQAEQRVKLGMQLFKAAEAQVAQHRDALKIVRDEQERLRAEIQEDVTKTLHQYDQWVGQIDESFTTAIRKLTDRLDRLEAEVGSSQQRLEAMVRRAEALLDQARLTTDPAAPAPRPAAPERKPPERSGSGPTAPAPAEAEAETEPPKAPRIYSQLLRRLRTEEADTADPTDKAA